MSCTTENIIVVETKENDITSGLTEKCGEECLIYLTEFVGFSYLYDTEQIEKYYQFDLQAKQLLKYLSNEYGIETMDTGANFITIKVMSSLGKEPLSPKENIRLTTGAFFGYNELMRMSFCNDLELLELRLKIIFTKLKI